MRYKLLVCVCLAATLLTGCASMGVRQPLDFNTLGHAEQYQLNQATFKLNFTSAVDTRYVDPEEIALLHAALITQQHGFKYLKYRQYTAITQQW